MERSQSLYEEGEPRPFSCWGHLSFNLLWCKRKRRATANGSSACSRLTAVFKTRGLKSKPGSFRYDPLSYAQNFDEGSWEEESENQDRGFSARFAVLAAKPPQHQ